MRTIKMARYPLASAVLAYVETRADSRAAHFWNRLVDHAHAMIACDFVEEGDMDAAWGCVASLHGELGVAA